MAAFGLGGFGDMRGGPGGLGGMGIGGPRGFEEQYHCYPVSFQVTYAIFWNFSGMYIPF